MSNRRIQDPVEATFRDLRGAVYAADGHAAMAAIKRRPGLHAFHRVADDRRRGRARHWLAESGLRPTVPGEPAPLGRPDLHGHP